METTQRVYLLPHDPSWQDEFTQASSVLADAIGDILVEIHHIGSTAIPAIYAKPIIDMLAVVTNLSKFDQREDWFNTLGYEVMGEFGIPGRRYFRKNDADGNRTHQLHAFQESSSQIRRHLVFRDFLRVHPIHANQYSDLKRHLADLYPSDISRYTDGKNTFIEKIDSLAVSWVRALDAAPQPCAINLR